MGVSNTLRVTGELRHCEAYLPLVSRSHTRAQEAVTWALGQHPSAHMARGRVTGVLQGQWGGLVGWQQPYACAPRSRVTVALGEQVVNPPLVSSSTVHLC